MRTRPSFHTPQACPWVFEHGAQCSVGCGEVLGGELAVAPGPKLVAHSLPLAKRCGTRPLDGGDVNERVGRSVVRRDEAETLTGIEPLDSPDLGGAGRRAGRFLVAGRDAVGRPLAREVFGGLSPVAAGSRLVPDTVALAERSEPRPFDRGGVNEDVRRASLRRDEAAALGRVEPRFRSALTVSPTRGAAARRVEMMVARSWPRSGARPSLRCAVVASARWPFSGSG